MGMDGRISTRSFCLCSEPRGHQEASSESWPCPKEPHVPLSVSPAVCVTLENALLTSDLICRIKMLNVIRSLSLFQS